MPGIGSPPVACSSPALWWGLSEDARMCGFCSATPVAVCPICSPVNAAPVKMRKAGKAKATPPGFQRVSFSYQINASPAVPISTFAPKAPPLSPSWRADVDRLRQIAINDERMRELSEAISRAEAAKAVKAIPAPRPSPVLIPWSQVQKAPQKPAQAARVAPLTVVTNADWEAAARFTRAVLRVPLMIESTCKRVDAQAEVTQIHRPGNILRGDWAGLARAVDAGSLSEKEAIELAQTWRKGVANG